MEESSARVHIILARKSDRAIAIRRGPSREVCTIGWDRKNDTFSIGQWLKGRIYERHCDLSPDGKYFIYFAMNGQWSSQTKGSWTAISRSHYLKAIGLWANGSGWNGGGLFLSNDSYWLNSGNLGQEQLLKPANPLRESKKYPFHERYGGECPGVYYVRLQRDGWVLKKQANNAESDSFTIFEKPLGRGWSLVKTAHATINELPGKGCYYDTHRLVNRDQEIALDYPDWEWADLDHGRMVWVEHGVLYSAEILEEGLSSVKSLYDFNTLKFEAIKAPY